MEMMELLPDSPGQFIDINGVGKHKLEAYGDAFIEVIRQHA
jgi:superfamily II DNA helicase RecQ